MSCALCHTRKEKRFCPALHERICPVCCGREREVTLDCPSECPHLQEARRHERRSMEDVEPAALFPQVTVREQLLYEREPLLAGLSHALGAAAHSERELRDSDIIAALTTLAQRLQTLVSSGLHVPAQSLAGAQQALVGELERLIATYREEEQKHMGFATLKDSELLGVIVFLLRMALAQTSGRPKSRAFVDFLREQFPPAAGAAQPGLIAAP